MICYPKISTQTINATLFLKKAELHLKTALEQLLSVFHYASSAFSFLRIMKPTFHFTIIMGILLDNVIPLSSKKIYDINDKFANVIKSFNEYLFYIRVSEFCSGYIPINIDAYQFKSSKLNKARFLK